jgi:hypothetical protein
MISTKLENFSTDFRKSPSHYQISWKFVQGNGVDTGGETEGWIDRETDRGIR